HRDIKPQNLLFPYAGASRSELTLIDFDVSERLESGLDDLATLPSDIAQRLVDDVHSFGELLYNLATGAELPVDGLVTPRTSNAAFNTLVSRCLAAEVSSDGYASLADAALWHDLNGALSDEQAQRTLPPRGSNVWRALGSRRTLAGLCALLFMALVVAIVEKIQTP
ncbi:MAG TPA: hypothetical protein VGQ62_01145, partial [Chloroflexota bacterium]|nr:hypothetical protein [Chloroflexota bacterium]